MKVCTKCAGIFQHASWCPLHERSHKNAPIIIRDLDGREMPLGPRIDAKPAYGDTRARAALTATATGESMATWEPRYIREARAIFNRRSARGQLWERVGGTL